MKIQGLSPMYLLLHGEGFRLCSSFGGNNLPTFNSRCRSNLTHKLIKIVFAKIGARPTKTYHSWICWQYKKRPTNFSKKKVLLKFFKKYLLLKTLQERTGPLLSTNTRLVSPPMIQNWHLSKALPIM